MDEVRPVRKMVMMTTRIIAIMLADLRGGVVVCGWWACCCLFMAGRDEMVDIADSCVMLAVGNNRRQD